MDKSKHISLFGLDFDLHVFILLVSSPLLLSLYYYHGITFYEFIPQLVSDDHGDLNVRYGQFICFFILLGLIPLLYVLIVDKNKLNSYGLGLGDKKMGLKILLLIPLVIIPLMWVAAKMPDVRAEYPLAKILFQQPQLFWPYEVMYIVFYYIAWEFYFRGFLLFGLSTSLGPGVAILIQTLASCLIHLGKPEGETIGAIVVGLLFGFIAWKTKSVWYGFLLHISIGFFTDYFILKQASIHLMGN
ncbi:MAG: CPBP family intramembrane glutamic endopeptidase [Saprospiraceae bacterium]